MAQTRTAYEVAKQAIELFLEYRDKHGKDEQSAAQAAALEVDKGTGFDVQVVPSSQAPAGSGDQWPRDLRVKTALSIAQDLREMAVKLDHGYAVELGELIQWILVMPSSFLDNNRGKFVAYLPGALVKPVSTQLCENCGHPADVHLSRAEGGCRQKDDQYYGGICACLCMHPYREEDKAYIRKHFPETKFPEDQK